MFNIGILFSSIKKYWKWIVAGYVVIITVLLFLFIHSYKNAKAENSRLSNNQAALLTDIEYYKTENGKNAAKVMELEVTKGEFEKLFPELQAEIKNLKIKNKYLESISSTGMDTDVNGSTKLKDTVYVTVVDSIRIENKAKTFKWSDPWNEIQGTIYPDETVGVSYHGRDTLTMAAVRVPKRFLFFKYGTKYIEVDAVNANPSTKILYNKKIKLTKKKK